MAKIIDESNPIEGFWCVVDMNETGGVGISTTITKVRRRDGLV